MLRQVIAEAQHALIIYATKWRPWYFVKANEVYPTVQIGQQSQQGICMLPAIVQVLEYNILKRQAPLS